MSTLPAVTVLPTPEWIALHQHCEHWPDGRCRYGNPNYLGTTCTFYTSPLGATPITQCGKPARHRVWATSPSARTESIYATVCSEAHLAEDVRAIALHEVCDFRVERYFA